ncbi:MAG: DUF3298 domain-containing protein [Clostridiales bacterium]|nr:DUF3298 domain-containing protein [Clostridiales bacterium]
MIKTKRWVIILIIVAVIAITAVGCILFLKGKDNINSDILQKENNKESKIEVIELPFYSSNINDGGENVLIFEDSYGEYFIMDKEGNNITKTGDQGVIHRGYNYISSFSEEVARVEYGGKYNFIKNTGEPIIPSITTSGDSYVDGIYDDARDFKQEVAAVKKDNKWGYIDKEGNEVIPFIYDYATSFNGKLAVVRNEGKYGVINKVGKEIVPLTYDEVLYGDDYYMNLDNDKSFIIVKKDNKIGIINETGKIVVPCIYDEFSYADYEGIVYDEYEEREYLFFEGMAKVIKNGKYGYINRNGKEVIPCIYDYAYTFSEGFARVCKDDKWVYIDKEGNEIIFDDYEYIYDFNNGMARFMKDDKFGFINAKGENIISINNLYDEVSDFNEGLAAVKKDNKWGYIDENGNEVISFIYDSAYTFSEGMAKVIKDGKCGYINRNGNEVVSCIYDKIERINDEYFKVLEIKELPYKDVNGNNVKSRHYGIIKITGEEIIPCEYDDIVYLAEENTAFARIAAQLYLIKIKDTNTPDENYSYSGNVKVEYNEKTEIIRTNLEYTTIVPKITGLDASITTKIEKQLEEILQKYYIRYAGSGTGPINDDPGFNYPLYLAFTNTNISKNTISFTLDVVCVFGVTSQTETLGYTFDLTTGELLDWKTLVNNKEKYIYESKKIILEQLKKDSRYEEVVDNDLNYMDTIEYYIRQNDSWYFTEGKLCIVIPRYAIASGAAREFVFEIPLNEMNGIIKKYYITQNNS